MFDIPKNKGFALVQYDRLFGIITGNSVSVLYPGKKIKTIKNDYITNLKSDYSTHETENLIEAYFTVAWSLYN